MYLFYFLLLTLPLLALKKRTPDSPSVLDVRSTTCIKGVLCFYVMFHNLGLDLEGNSVAKELICEHTGGVGVGLFFFLSAFGIIRSYQKKGNKYLLRLLFVHIPKLYLISVGINLLTYFVFFEGAFQTPDLLMRIFNLDVFNDFNRMNRHGWYISSIIALYLIFAVVYFACSRLKTDKKFVIAGIVLACISVGFRLWAQIADRGGMYTREMPTFAIGCIYATFYEQINAFAQKHFNWGMIASVLVFFVGFIFFEPLASYTGALIIILVSQKFTYDNPITHFFGKICIGVYLFLHFSSLVLQNFLANEYLWVLLNGAFIIELSVLLYGAELLIAWLVKRFSRREKNVELKV